MACRQKEAVKRLIADQKEFLQSPVANVSATPLDSDMFEWHCNIEQDGFVYHLVLFFPKDYPYTSPSAEFVPHGFRFQGGAYMEGKKGTKICLSIFSDFADLHTEWAQEKGTGWSPAYTAQTVLLNLVSFLSETTCHDPSAVNNYKRISKNFTCPDCGHTQAKPYPPLTNEATLANQPAKPDEENDADRIDIVDYISKSRFAPIKPEAATGLFGYGLIVSGPPGRARLTTPCEYLTAGSFYRMKRSNGDVLSMMKEKLSFFLPLYICPQHGSAIKNEFVDTMRKIADSKCVAGCPEGYDVSDTALSVIPNLMCATVVEFSSGAKHTSDNSLKGYFALHRLFLWALDTYPGLQSQLERRILTFVADETSRDKRSFPDLGQWLMLLSGSKQFRWADVYSSYLSECFRRNVMWYVKEDPMLGKQDTQLGYRLEQTFKLTSVSRNLLAFQTLFLDIATPKGMPREDIAQRYDENFGLPTEEMVAEMKKGCAKIRSNIAHYGDWYQALKVQVPSKESLGKILKDSVAFANKTNGYFFSQRPAGSAGVRGNRGGQRGRFR